ncbi:MAG: FG-GAP repeat protein [Planctomycetes bacterium]|nr:FG-GAP repeat protein [Planctomycetota bacterium]
MTFVLAGLALSASPAARAGSCDEFQGPGQVLAATKISATSGGFGGLLDPIDQFGKAVALLEDLDGDAVPDLAVGAYRDDDGGTDRGAVWILFLRQDGTVKSEQKISATHGGFTGLLDDEDAFGAALASPGDIDGDGVADLVVGAPFDDDGGLNRGAFWTLFLTPAGTVKAHAKVSATQGGLLQGTLDDFDYFAVSLAAAGDLDQDGVPDLAAGAINDDEGGANRGAVYLLRLAAGGTVKAQAKIASGVGGFQGTLRDGDWFGASLALAGDVDGDGFADLAAGAAKDDDGGTDRGAVWILFLDAQALVAREAKVSQTAGGFAGALSDSGWFGQSLAALGDVDGDGTADLAVGCPFDPDGGANYGAVYVLFLTSAGAVAGQQKISALSGGLPGPSGPYTFGWSVAPLGDLDGDLAADLAVGSNRDGDGGLQKGAVWVLFLSDERWRTHAAGVPGAWGLPCLRGAGPLIAGTTAALQLSSAPPGALTLLVLGASELSLPFAGGLFYPSPDVIAALPADGAGSFTVAGTWPAQVPVGDSACFQVWIPDATAAWGCSASHGLRATQP